MGTVQIMVGDSVSAFLLQPSTQEGAARAQWGRQNSIRLLQKEEASFLLASLADTGDK